MDALGDSATSECFVYRLAPGREAEYDLHHAHVWAEVIEQLRATGVVDYSIFRRDDLVISFIRRSSDVTRDIDERVRARVAEWHALMAPLLRATEDESGAPMYATRIFDISELQYASDAVEVKPWTG